MITSASSRECCLISLLGFYARKLLYSFDDLDLFLRDGKIKKLSQKRDMREAEKHTTQSTNKQTVFHQINVNDMW